MSSLLTEGRGSKLSPGAPENTKSYKTEGDPRSACPSLWMLSPNTLSSCKDEAASTNNNTVHTLGGFNLYTAHSPLGGPFFVL